MSSEQPTVGGVAGVKEQLNDAKPGSESLSINRVPSRAVSEFKDLADAEFSSDYGMTLTFLLKYYHLDQAHEQTLAPALDRMTEIEERVEGLESAVYDSDRSDSGVDTLG